MAIFGPRLIARMEPWNVGPVGPSGKTDLEILCESIGALFDPLLSIAEESGSDGEAAYIPAYGRLFEVKTATLAELRYLSNYIGVSIPAGATEAEARVLCEAESGLERGTLKAVEAAIKRIIGSAPFTIQERTSLAGGVAAYHFNVLVGAGKSSAALITAIEEVKPGGVMFSVLEIKNSWLQAVKIWSATGATAWSAAKEGNT
jgi:hypothetical protein